MLTFSCSDNITEEDGVQWQLILQHSMTDLSDEEMKEEKLMTGSS